MIATTQGMFTNKPDPSTDPSPPMIYEVTLQGHLGQQWTEWFDGAAINLKEDGNTVVTCSVIDQAALHGLLKKVRDLGMSLLAVNSITPGEADVSDVKQEMNDRIKLGGNI